MKLLKDKLLNSIKNLPCQVGISLKLFNTNQQLIINNRRFLAASTIKIPIMLATFKKIQDNEINYNTQILITQNHLVEDSPYISTLNLPTKLSVKKLIKYMIIVSDNTATNILIDLLTIDFINQLLNNWGFINTILNRKMMDFISREQGIDNWTTPLEMSTLLEKLLKHELLYPKYSNESLEILSYQQDREKIPSGLPKNIKVANKPGELPGSRSDVGIVWGKKTFILSIFCDNLIKDELADIYISNITREIYNFINQNT